MIVADNETALDLLYYEAIARTVDRLFAEKSDEALSVGVHGDWGAGNPTDVNSVSISSDLVPLIERSFRYTYMLATRMRDDMMESGHRPRMKELIKEAQELQKSLQDGASE